jgi:hypothetical protein
MNTENIVDETEKAYSTPELTVHGEVVEITYTFDPSGGTL